MPKQFDFVVKGKHSSGKSFRKQIVVVAQDEKEARNELAVCLDYHENVLGWELESLEAMSAVESGSRLADWYVNDGAYALYSPGFDFIEER